MTHAVRIWVVLRTILNILSLDQVAQACLSSLQSAGHAVEDHGIPDATWVHHLERTGVLCGGLMQLLQH